MMAHQQNEELAQAVNKALARKNLSVNAAHIRLGFDRQMLTRLTHGIPARLDVLEDVARKLGEDVNEWRVLAGYPPVEARPSPEAVETCARLFVQELTTNPQAALPYARQIVEATRVAEAKVGYQVAPVVKPELVTSEADFQIPDRFADTIPRSPFFQHYVNLAREWWQENRLKYPVIPSPFAVKMRTGYIFRTSDEAHAEFLGWLEDIRKANPRLDRPKELHKSCNNEA